ncbi:transcription/translation regulatory transformer protein RfaH [Shewanella intestini]|uniref:Transcription antitermination protein RfaH n=1 Tax=Shewanella intestini TaxID=2017544 RepID=A0ABS5I2G0_9GAMM|nr:MULTISPECIES: transcription/translation regulatory transformer protein RfaH [Shewanella]MBR9728212.1 transcription/translation regulatory transformer protein RfaH [Shewanella intestini]MRG35677.1 transcription/translation regulatory transformer protein RfaH [Shewanella sp. XMDDZSB0408]
MKAWYLVYCKPREEVRAQQNLALQGVNSYLPMMKQLKKVANQTKEKLVETPLFPSYLFIQFDPTEFSVSKVHSTRGVNRIVGCNEFMTPIADTLVEQIKLRCDNEQAPQRSPKDLVKGDKVKFVDGPFAELNAIFEEMNAEKRCFVLFTIMGQQKRIAVDKQSIEKI